MSDVDFTSVTTGGGSTARTLNDLAADRDALAKLARTAAVDAVAPSQMSKDEANAYMAKIANLFPGVPRLTVEMELAIWSMLNDVGAEQDYTGKPGIVVGGRSVPATSVYGGIIPVDNRGLPRKFCSTMFEAAVPGILDARPDIRMALTPRAIAVGLQAGEEAAVVSFNKGVAVQTAGVGYQREMAKRAAIAAKVRSPPSTTPVTPVVREVPTTTPAPHNLF